MLASLIGGSGIAVSIVKDGRINAQSAAQRATAELTFYDALVRGLVYETAEDTTLVPGRVVAVSITRPAVVQQAVTAQQVRIRQQGVINASSTLLARTVDARPTRVTLTQILQGKG